MTRSIWGLLVLIVALAFILPALSAAQTDAGQSAYLTAIFQPITLAFGFLLLFAGGGAALAWASKYGGGY